MNYYELLCNIKNDHELLGVIANYKESLGITENCYEFLGISKKLEFIINLRSVALSLVAGERRAHIEPHVLTSDGQVGRIHVVPTNSQEWLVMPRKPKES